MMIADQLWTKYKNNRTDKCRNDLVLHYMHLVNRHANSVQSKIFAYSKAELLGAAAEGLIRAIENYDPSRNNSKFEIFSSYRIRGAIIDWIRAIDKQGRTVRIFEKEKEKAHHSLMQNGYYGDSDIAEHMGISLDRYNDLNDLLGRGKAVFFSSLMHHERDDNAVSWEIEDARYSDPDRAIDHQFAGDFLRNFIKEHFCRTDRMILLLYYFEGINLREIGEILNYTESHIANMRKRAISHLIYKLQGTQFEQEGALLAQN